jgi:hypothetical protein
VVGPLGNRGGNDTTVEPRGHGRDVAEAGGKCTRQGVLVFRQGNGPNRTAHPVNKPLTSTDAGPGSTHRCYQEDWVQVSPKIEFLA